MDAKKKEGKNNPEEPKRFRLSPFRVWTIETITAGAAIIALFSMIAEVVDQVSIVPREQAEYSNKQGYEKGRVDKFNEISRDWSIMRVGFQGYIKECQSDKPSQDKLKEYYKQNADNVALVREAGSGAAMDYYWGKSIHKIYDYELRWYIKYSQQCPTKAETQGKIFDIFHARENNLMLLMLTKMYNPHEHSKNFDNRYYAKF